MSLHHPLFDDYVAPPSPIQRLCLSIIPRSQPSHQLCICLSQLSFHGMYGGICCCCFPFLFLNVLSFGYTDLLLSRPPCFILCPSKDSLFMCILFSSCPHVPISPRTLSFDLFFHLAFPKHSAITPYLESFKLLFIFSVCVHV